MADFQIKYQPHFAPEAIHKSLVLMVAKAAYTRDLTAYLQKSRDIGEDKKWASSPTR